MEYVVAANRSFEDIEKQTMAALERQGFVVQRTFSLHSATAPSSGNTGGYPGYSVILLYGRGAQRRPLGVVSLYERQGYAVIQPQFTPTVVYQKRPSARHRDTQAKLEAALGLSELMLALSSAGTPGECGEEVTIMLKDPVCGKRINRHKAQAAVEYEGTVYYVCCPLCQSEFERDPGHYAWPEMGQKARPAKGKRRRR